MPINYKLYPPNWKTEIRPRILARSNNRCEFCGIENMTVIGSTKTVYLSIAHLDHDPENHNITDDRLAALCPKCHFHYDSTQNVRKRKYGRDVNKQPTLF